MRGDSLRYALDRFVKPAGIGAGHGAQCRGENELSSEQLERFPTKVRRPEDFDAFWDVVLAALAQIPLNASVEPVPLRSTPEVETFAVHYDSLDGVRISGWY